MTSYYTWLPRYVTEHPEECLPAYIRLVERAENGQYPEPPGTFEEEERWLVEDDKAEERFEGREVDVWFWRLEDGALGVVRRTVSPVKYNPGPA